MKQYNPKPAPRMGPKLKGTATKNYVQTSFDIPVAIVNRVLNKSLELEPETNLQEVTAAAIRWFLVQKEQKTFPLFFRRYLVISDLHSEKVPVVLTEKLAEYGKLKATAEAAIKWFLSQPIEKIAENFTYQTYTIYLRGAMKEEIEAYIARLRAYGQDLPLQCKVKATITGFVTTAMSMYYYEYLLKQQTR